MPRKACNRNWVRLDSGIAALLENTSRGPMLTLFSKDDAPVARMPLLPGTACKGFATWKRSLRPNPKSGGNAKRPMSVFLPN